MKKTVLLVSILSLLASCGDTSNTPNFIGDAETRGFCGKLGEDYKVPISSDIDTDIFEKVTDVEEGMYRATRLSIYYRESETDLESPQVLATHTRVFESNEFAPTSFFKNCARGFALESEGLYKATLPLKLTLNRDQTWSTQLAADYTVEYRSDLLGGLKLIAQLSEDASPSSDDQDFNSAILITPILKEKALKPVMSYDEFQDYYLKASLLNNLGFGAGRLINLEKEYGSYLAKQEAKAQAEAEAFALQMDAPKNLYLQIDVSSNPKVFARIEIVKVDETAEAPAKPE